MAEKAGKDNGRSKRRKAMADKLISKDIGNLKLEIEPDSLRRVIAEGRLSEFVATVASEAHAHISSQIVEKVAEAALNPDGLQTGISIDVGYIFEGGDFATVPPIPRWGVGPIPGVRSASVLSRVASAVPQSGIQS